MQHESNTPQDGCSSAIDPTNAATTGEISINQNASGSGKGDQVSKDDTPSMKNFWRIFTYSTPRDRAILIFAGFCAVIAGTALPFMNIIFGRLVGDFTNYFIPGSGITESQFRKAVDRNALYIFALFFGKFLFTYVTMICFRITGIRISAALRLAYLRALFSQPVKKLDLLSPGTVANTITSSTTTIQMSISDKLSQFIQAVALLLAAYAIAFRYSWRLTLVTSSSILFVLVVYGILTPFALRAQQRIEKADEKHSSVAAEVFSSIRTVVSLGAQSPLSAKYNVWVEESKRKALGMSTLTGLQTAPLFFSIYASFALSFWYGIKLYRDGYVDGIGSVVIVFFSVLIVVAVLGMIVSPLMMVAKAAGVSTAFFDMIDQTPSATNGLDLKDLSAHENIEFRNVTFEYPTRQNVKVLKGFSAMFEHNKTTALVGVSGSGKSTIVALLEKWYNLDDTGTGEKVEQNYDCHNLNTLQNTEARSIQAGDTHEVGVYFGPHSLKDINTKWWRSKIGLVSQEPFLFNDTIFNNVAFGLEGSPWANEAEHVKLSLVEQACKEAFADEFIHKLPRGYATMVGESGIKLSGGQRQRIAIARSIVKQPPILILDEATSSIDVRGEKIVQAALERVSEGRTTIVIAHRLSTISRADKIVVMRDGVKIEEGTHEALLATTEGLYSGLVHAQHLDRDTLPEIGLIEHAALMATGNAELKAETLEHTDVTSSETPTSFKKKGFFGTLGLFVVEQKQHWIYYVFILLSAMGGGAAFALQSWFFAQLINVFQYVGSRLREASEFWSLMFFVLALSVAACYFVLGFSMTAIAAHIAATYRVEYFQNILRKPISFFDAEGNASGTLMSRLSADPKTMQELLATNASFPLISIFNVTGCLIISIYFGWKLALVTIFAGLPVIFAAAFFRIRFEIQFEQLNAKVFASSSQFATEAVGAFRTVSSLTMEDYIINRYSSLLQEQIRDAQTKAYYAMLVYSLADSIELCAMALTFWYGGQLLASHEYNVLQFFVVYTAIVQGGQSAGQFSSFAPNIANATAAGNRILSLQPTVDEKSKKQQSSIVPHNQNSFGARIEFKDVTFKYPSRNSPTFCNLNITIEPGQFVGFVGASGCGKTTIISLLEQFYDCTSGAIYFNGQDIQSLDIVAYRKYLSLVSQEPRLFNGTIRENLVLGLNTAYSASSPNDDGDDHHHNKNNNEETRTTPTVTTPEEQIIQACRDAEIHEFITSLPEGYDTQLGINTQTALSGGQKQRLCLARALLRRPRLLLLDEATSSLDSQSERLVQTALEKLTATKDVTVVAVAHRLATIQKADFIFVFGEGGGVEVPAENVEESVEATNRGDRGSKIKSAVGAKILERGTHAELLQRRGAYWQMCQAQALDR